MESLQALVHHPNKTLALSPASVAARPYFQLLMQSATGEDLLILGNIDNGRQAWYSAHRQILFLRHGVLVKTWHMSPDIVATRFPASSPFVTGLEHVTAPVTTTRSLDLPDYRYGITATSHLVPQGTHSITILGHTHRVLLINEHIRARAIGFAADNQYWVDPHTGFIWKSRQTIPGGKTLTFTQIRPYPAGQA